MWKIIGLYEILNLSFRKIRKGQGVLSEYNKTIIIKLVLLYLAF